MPVVAARTWHYTAMSAATFAFSTLLSYIATEAICKLVDDYLRGVGMPRNNRRVEQMLGIGY